MAPDDAVLVGIVLRAHGLRGGLLVRFFPARGAPGLPPRTELMLDGTPRGVTAFSARDGEVGLVGLAGLTDRDSAKALVGSEVRLDREAAMELPFLPLHLFEGMTLGSGGRTYRVVDVIPDRANPMLVLRSGDGPADPDDADTGFPVPVALVLAEGYVDWSSGTIEVELPKGLDELAPKGRGAGGRH